MFEYNSECQRSRWFSLAKKGGGVKNLACDTIPLKGQKIVISKLTFVLLRVSQKTLIPCRDVNKFPAL